MSTRMVILRFSYVVADSSRKLHVRFFVVNLLNKIKPFIGCWQNFKYPRLSLYLAIMNCLVILKTNTLHQREGVGMCPVPGVCGNYFIMTFFFLRVARCKNTSEYAVYLPFFF